MEQLEVVYRPEAVSDLNDVFRIVLRASLSPATALSFTGRMRDRCQRIGDTPHGGRPRDDLAPGLRTVPFERSAVIAYVVTERVEITNVFYSGRDYETLYRDESS